METKEMTTEPAARREYKDTVFRMLFGEPENLLALYNAMSGKHYTDAAELKIVTLENAIYCGMKDDLAYIIHANLYLYEQQSTVNLNMPLRLLFYVADEYQALTVKKNLYGHKRIPLNAPHFVVFYNGLEAQPEHQVQKLSDAYVGNDGDVDLELKVHVLNINDGFNTALKEQCQLLNEYMLYVDCVRRYRKEYPLDTAVSMAVDECIRDGILREFLLANKAEVIKMSIYEYDDAEVKRMLREEAKEEGWESGLAEGEARGETKGRTALCISLLREGLLTREQAFKYCGLPKEEFEGLLRAYT